MRISLPVEDRSLDGKVSQSFGRASYYLIYDTDTKESEFIDNSAAMSRGGAGIKASQIIVDNNIDVLITPRCGQNAADVISSANTIMYKTINDSIRDNINGFYDKKLEVLNDIHPGYHDHGGK